MTIRLSIKDGKLNASFTDYEKPYRIHIVDEQEYQNAMGGWNNSFQSISLSEGAEKYIHKTFGEPFYNENLNCNDWLLLADIELLESECDVFEIRKEPFDFGTMYNEVLHLKEPVAPSRVVSGGYVPMNKVGHKGLQVLDSVAPVNAVEDNQDELIDEIDFECMMLEDTLHGTAANRITKVRGLLSTLKSKFTIHKK